MEYEEGQSHYRMLMDSITVNAVKSDVLDLESVELSEEQAESMVLDLMQKIEIKILQLNGWVLNKATGYTIFSDAVSLLNTSI